MATLDVVLINPGSRTRIYQALGASLTAVEPPVWAGLIATFLRVRGTSVVIIDAEAEELTPEHVAERVESLGAILAAIVVYGHQPSASTQNMTGASLIASAIKQRSPSQRLLLLGGHVASLPERTLREEAADFVATGEGPYTVAELAEALKAGESDWTKVRGLGWREGDDVRFSAPAPLVRDVDREMPGMAWDLLPMPRYRAHNWHCFDGLQRQPYAAIYTTLGCPYHCSFCLRKGTLVITAQGKNRKIEELQVGDKLMAWDETAGQLAETTITANGSRWVNKLLRVRMRTGQTLEITDEHPVYTSRGWVEAGHLRVDDQILLMEPADKVSYLRRVYNPARRPEVRAKIAAYRRLNNPVNRPEVRAKISATLKLQRDVLSQRMKLLHAQGRMPRAPMSEEHKRQASERMTLNNPMRDAATARRMGETLKQGIVAGRVLPYMMTPEGRQVIGEIARQRALTNNPMKDPAIALAADLRARRAEIMRELWQDEAAADRLMKSREGTYVTGERHWHWRGGVSNDPYPAEFSGYLKRKIRTRDGFACQLCDRRDILSVHHVDYDKANCDPCNLITLCIPCNSRVNANRDRWQAYFTEKMALTGNCPHFVSIESIEEVEGEFQVFNFQCAPHDNYFAEFLLVHNCCIQAPFKQGEKLMGLKETTNSYRFWSPARVLDELELLATRYGVRNIKIADEMFVLNPKHIESLCNGIVERGLKFNFWAYARVDTVRDGMVDKLKAAGFNWLAFGIEAANERVRTDVQKGFGQELIFGTLNKVRAGGINVIGNYIFGLPEDDYETMQQTLDLALELNCEFGNFYSAMAYPGSQLYELAMTGGWPLPQTWSGYSQHAEDTLPLPTKYLSAGEVLRFRDEAFQTYFRSPKYLEMIGQRFGPETVAHVREMVTHPLKRRFIAPKRAAVAA